MILHQQIDYNIHHWAWYIGLTSMSRFSIGITLYLKVLHGIALYGMVLHDIAFDSIIFHWILHSFNYCINSMFSQLACTSQDTCVLNCRFWFVLHFCSMISFGGFLAECLPCYYKSSLLLSNILNSFWLSFESQQ